MKYNSPNRERLSRTEFALLGLIAEAGENSGYRLHRLIEERGFREWAGLGQTSIYTGLKKLEARGLIAARLETAKQGKGPPPRLAALTEAGAEALRLEVAAALAGAESNWARFELALAALPVLGARAAVEALAGRRRGLEARLDHVSAKYEAQGGDKLPLHVQALFEHGLAHLRTEIGFLDALIGRLAEAGKGGENAQARLEKGAQTPLQPPDQGPGRG